MYLDGLLFDSLPHTRLWMFQRSEHYSRDCSNCEFPAETCWISSSSSGRSGECNWREDAYEEWIDSSEVSVVAKTATIFAAITVLSLPILANEQQREERWIILLLLFYWNILLLAICWQWKCSSFFFRCKEWDRLLSDWEARPSSVSIEWGGG